MPARIIVEDNELLGPEQYTLHSVPEAVALAADRAGAGQVTVVFTHTTAVAAAAAAGLRRKGLRTGSLTEQTPVVSRREVVEDLRQRRVDALVVTDGVQLGWRAPAGCRIVHAEVPQYGPGFTAVMNQRLLHAASY